MVPADLQSAVWKNYRRGQEVDKNPSAAYLDIARQAIAAVQAKEKASGKNPVARPHQLQVHQRTMNLWPPDHSILPGELEQETRYHFWLPLGNQHNDPGSQPDCVGALYRMLLLRTA
jgi:hypothetical protein